MKKRLEQVMKKVSLLGVGLGIAMGLIVGLLWGSWIFWLGTGLVIGALLGSAATRRSLLESANAKGRLNP
jgi:hypothetical protein